MVEAIVFCSSILASLGIAAKTVVVVIGLYYKDKDKARLERLDRQLQLGTQPVVDEDSILARIIGLAEIKSYPYEIGEGVLDELRKKNLITPGRANYIMIGANSHRGRDH